MTKRRSLSKSELRNIRIQQIIFVAIGIIVILTMIIGLVK